MVWRNILRPVGDDQQYPQARQSTTEKTKKIQRRLVCPMQVLQHQQRRHAREHGPDPTKQLETVHAGRIADHLL